MNIVPLDCWPDVFDYCLLHDCFDIARRVAVLTNFHPMKKLLCVFSTSLA